MRRIAVLRANGLGDFVFTLPALDALRRAWPEAAIVLLGTPLHRDLLARRPGPVDRVVVVPASEGVWTPAGARPDPADQDRFFAAMRAEGFDLALQLHGGGRWSNPFVRRLGAACTVGLRTPDAAPLDRWVPYGYWQHEVLRLLEVVALAGAEPGPGGLEPRLAVTEADRREAAAVLAGSQSQPGRPLAVLAPGAGDGRRRWPPDRLAAAGDALHDAGAAVVVCGSAADRGLAQAVAGAMARPAADLAGSLSLGGLAGILAGAAVVVANDSGPLHLAAAVGAPTVGVYWCGNLVNAGPLTRARHRTAVSWRLACPVCGADCMREGCDHDASFVADVEVGEVAAAALDLLATTASGQHPGRVDPPVVDGRRQLLVEGARGDHTAAPVPLHHP